MADAREFSLFDSTGAPATGVSLSSSNIVDFKDRSGNNRGILPSLVELGGGKYAAIPTDDDETTACVLLVDAGASYEPRYHVFAIHKADNSNQFWAGYTTDEAGALWTGAQVTVASYSSRDGAAVTPQPSILTLATYLWCATPTADDIETDVAISIVSPAGALPAYFTGGTVPIVGGLDPLESTFGVDPEGLAIRALREWLLRALPAKTAALNLTRNATLRAPGIGPFTIPSGASLKVSAVSLQGAWTTAPLTSGTRTATQLAADVTTAAPSNVTAGVDGSGYFYVTSDVEPSASANLNSFMGVGSDSTGANLAIGWEAGGEHVLNPPLRPPSFRGVTDGHPVMAPDMGKGMWVILGDRSTVMYQNNSYRRDEYETTISVEVYRPDANQNPNRNREAISSTVRAIRECLMSDTGKQLGRASAGDIVFAKVINTKISSRPFSFEGSNSPNVFFDVALLTVVVRTFQRPVTAAQN